MPRYRHDDPTMVFACPGCNVAGRIYRRTNFDECETGEEFHCFECGDVFDDPLERAARQHVATKKPATGTLARDLLDANPDQVGSNL